MMIYHPYQQNNGKVNLLSYNNFLIICITIKIEPYNDLHAVFLLTFIDKKDAKSKQLYYPRFLDFFSRYPSAVLRVVLFLTFPVQVLVTEKVAHTGLLPVVVHDYETFNQIVLFYLRIFVYPSIQDSQRMV
jgi:hypothetical protein